MKTLYVTDLDGTLLNSNVKLSEYTIKTINSLIESGMCFSYATARSLSSSSVVTNGLDIINPIILFNGTFIIDPINREKHFSLYFNKNEINIVKDILTINSIYPMVFAYINGEEKVSWIESMENEGIKNYKIIRKGDSRLRPIQNIEQLYEGEIYYFSCDSDKYNNLVTTYEYLNKKNEFNCIFGKEPYKDIYSYEIMLKKATKGNAILKLKEMLLCDKIISFGDSINDIPMFKISDECYAVENAVEELKTIATGIIESNENDGVAKWLEKNYITINYN